MRQLWVAETLVQDHPSKAIVSMHSLLNIIPTLQQSTYLYHNIHTSEGKVMMSSAVFGPIVGWIVFF